VSLSTPTALTAAVLASAEAAITSAAFTPAARSLIIVAVSSFTASGTGAVTYSITDTLGGLAWSKVESTNGGTGNAATATLFYAIAPASPGSGTVTVTPSTTGAGTFGAYVRVFGITGNATSSPVAATGTSATATVALSTAPAATSEVVVLGTAGQGSDPATTQPPGVTALDTDVHSGSYTYTTIGYKNGSASQSNTFGGSLPNGAAVALEVVEGSTSTMTSTVAYGDTVPVLNGATLPRPNTVDEAPEQVGDVIELAAGGLRRYDLGERRVWSLAWNRLTEAELASIRAAAARGAVSYTHTDGTSTTVLVDGRPHAVPLPGTSPVRFDVDLVLREQTPRL
jgi:hypothetical protein